MKPTPSSPSPEHTHAVCHNCQEWTHNCTCSSPSPVTVEQQGYCPCYTYMDGGIDPGCPMHGNNGQSALGKKDAVSATTVQEKETSGEPVDVSEPRTVQGQTELQESVRDLLRYISNTPALLSLLYDIDMMPEQLREGTNAWLNMLRIADVFREQAPSSPKATESADAVGVLGAIQKELKKHSELAECQYAGEKLAGNIVKLEYWKGELAVLHMMRRLLSEHITESANVMGASSAREAIRYGGKRLLQLVESERSKSTGDHWDFWNYLLEKLQAILANASLPASVEHVEQEKEETLEEKET